MPFRFFLFLVSVRHIFAGVSDIKAYIKFDGVSFAYENSPPIFEDFSLSLAGSDGVIVTGPVGSGKTTLARLIVGSLKPQRGEIFIAGRPINRLSYAGRAILYSGWGIVSERSALLDDRSVLDNITAAMKLSTARVGRKRGDIENILRKCRMYSRRKARPSRLSQGEQRTLQIMMAIARNPIFLLWDDPDSFLDDERFEFAISEIRRLNLAGSTVILTTSHPDRYAHLEWPIISIGREL